MISYRVTMPEPHSHLFHVEITVDAVAEPELTLQLPVWTPGSYLVRDFARHVERFQLHEGAAAWRKTDKSSWQIRGIHGNRLRVSYAVYANELTVRTSHLDGSHGYFNGANLLMAVAGRTDEPLRLEVVPFNGWRVACALPQPAAIDGGMAYVAADYDELIDAPVECGTHTLLSFEVDEVPHQIALWGEGNYDPDRLMRDHRRIVETQRDMFGGLPYAYYLFIVHLTDGRGGGLEHRNSVTNAVDRWAFGEERSYRRYLSLTSHELFHVWNVKRLRPAALGPFDYQRENYTRLLWLMEGATSYYDDLLLVRAGLLTPEQFLANLADTIVDVQSRPGRLLQSLEASSFDAWIKFYRPDEHSANSSISYYTRGALVCFAFDMTLRRLSGGRCSLDDVMRALFAAYPIGGPGIPEDGAVLAMMHEVLGPVEGAAALDALYRAHVAGTEELDYPALFDTVGVDARWSHRMARKDGVAPGWIGLQIREQHGRLSVDSVRSDGPAHRAGIYAADQLLALNGWRVDEQRLAERIARLAPGTDVRITLFRGDRLLEVTLTVAAAPYDRLELVQQDELPHATAQREAWLAYPAGRGAQ